LEMEGRIQAKCRENDRTCEKAVRAGDGRCRVIIWNRESADNHLKRVKLRMQEPTVKRHVAICARRVCPQNQGEIAKVGVPLQVVPVSYRHGYRWLATVLCGRKYETPAARRSGGGESDQKIKEQDRHSSAFPDKMVWVIQEELTPSRGKRETIKTVIENKVYIVL